MNRSTKGALAAGAAATLLLGGAGTLAFWTDSATVDGSDISSGHLKLDATDCTTALWTMDGGATFNPNTMTLVPGDTLTKTCDIEVDVAGEHLTQVDLDVTVPSDVTGAQALVDELGAVVTVNGGGSADNVEVTDGQALPVSITVSWPYGSEDNDSNVATGLIASLADITVTTTQDHLDDAN